jgi:hypothetical protein
MLLIWIGTLPNHDFKDTDTERLFFDEFRCPKGYFCNLVGCPSIKTWELAVFALCDYFFMAL